MFSKSVEIRHSIMASIPPCHGGDLGSIPSVGGNPNPNTHSFALSKGAIVVKSTLESNSQARCVTDELI